MLPDYGRRRDLVSPEMLAFVHPKYRESFGHAAVPALRDLGGEDLDTATTADAVARIAQAAASLGGRLDSLEVNLLRITPAGPEALDVLVTTREDQP